MTFSFVEYINIIYIPIHYYYAYVHCDFVDRQDVEHAHLQPVSIFPSKVKQLLAFISVCLVFTIGNPECNIHA